MLGVIIKYLDMVNRNKENFKRYRTWFTFLVIMAARRVGCFTKKRRVS